MVESYVMIRTQDNPDGSYGPRADDIAPYAVSGEDVTARAFDVQGPAFINAMRTDPQVGVWRYRMSEATWNTMRTDPKLWMLVSRQYDVDTGETIQDNKDEVFSAAERNTRITQLGNFTDFDAATIAAWWTPDKTRIEVAQKLRNYLRTLNAQS